MSGATLERRLANYRAAIRSTAASDPSAAPREPGSRPDRAAAHGSIELGQRLADALDGELILDPEGPVVRVEPATLVLPLDRERLHGLPGQPPPDAPLVCLDTETTGLATASGTVAFLIGLGWWEDDRFRQVQLLLPDHPAERGLLSRLASHIPSNAWLVTYNGKGFDWPLLVARYRMARLPEPAHDGHLDLLPFVRRVFRHRMPDARLRSVETELLGSVRHGDVDGWQIPGLYLDFLRGGDAWPLIDVVRHNREDVRSLARLLGRIDVDLADPIARRSAPLGDLAGLARAFGRVRRLDEALRCVDAALEQPRERAGPAAMTDGSGGAAERRVVRESAAAFEPDVDSGTAPWWDPRMQPDIGGRRPRPGWERIVTGRLDSPWTVERVSIERARLLRRLGRYEEAVGAWLDLAVGPGAIAIHAWIEVAKLREHRLGDIEGALHATRRATGVAERRRRVGMGDPVTDRALSLRLERLVRRSATAPGLVGAATGGVGTGEPRARPEPASRCRNPKRAVRQAALPVSSSDERRGSGSSRR